MVTPWGFESPLSHQTKKALETYSRAFLLLYQLYSHVLRTILRENITTDFKATPHNSARSLRQDFCSNSKFRKWRNTVCISHFRNCGSGAKRRLRLADAIARCCLNKMISSFYLSRYTADRLGGGKKCIDFVF